MNWKYLSFYFGRGGWPDDAVWRVREDSPERQLLITHPIGKETVEEVQALWEEFQDRNEDDGFAQRVEPHYSSWTAVDGRTFYALNYWYVWNNPADAQVQWARDSALALGDPDEIPYAGGTPLWP